MTHLLESLRQLRPQLVRAAEGVFNGPDRNNNHRGGREKELKSQLNHLIAVCNEATCHDEIALYLRYQSARERPSIGAPLVDAMISGAVGVFQGSDFVRDNEALKVAAWRIYAVYLARAFTYYDSVQRNTRPRGNNASPAHQAGPRHRG